ncbi:heparan-alpha-glucosaminide N-acetyltransferase domain-containing protein [Sphingomonas sp. QA11]|uniref:DUF1624 domain-containing protein n=1 Tax=Sphingomonas sp. QA11 TaxID=2950605 RepID=UPI003FA78994|nr:heparan-alpha-glucosaminide N-acetyltransferase domain-containing protein [Sphingomonas sp. QA11]
MIVMTLDHVRDLIHHSAMTGLPTDLSTTTPLLFFSRWITHFCAPTFALCAGISASLSLQRSGSRAALSRHLLARGAWLMFLEVTLMRLIYGFNWSAEYPILLLVLWSFGLGMVALAAFIWIPRLLLGVLAATIVALHPMLEMVAPASSGIWAGLWTIIHQAGVVRVGQITLIAPYPMIPWAAVMALGFAIGPLFAGDKQQRVRWLTIGGVTALSGLAALRLPNLFGDPVPWTNQNDPMLTLLSLLNLTKYPASPQFLLLTLGVAALLLAWLDNQLRYGRIYQVVATFGRTPLFYYVLHFLAAHIIATAWAFIIYGAAASTFIFLPYPSIGGPAGLFPKDFGHSLWAVYMVWIIVLTVCYPVCRRYARARSERQQWWLSYL